MEQYAGSRSESDNISVSGAGEPPAAKKVKQCGPTSAELKPADVKGTFHPSGPKLLNVCCGSTISSLLALTVTNGLCVLYAKREVKPFGFLAVMGRLQG